MTPDSEQRTFEPEPTEFVSFVKLLDILLSVSRDELLKKLHSEKPAELDETVAPAHISSAGK